MAGIEQFTAPNATWMNYLYLLAGAAIFLLIVADIIKTTLSAQGGGAGTQLIARTVWRGFFAAAGRRGHHRLLDYAGLTILLTVLLFWVAGMWGGLLLVLLADAGSVVSSSTRAPASVVQKLYFAGYTLSTLGLGDYVPASNAWRLVTNIGSLAGLIFITTSITYFVPVLSAVNLQRQLSLYLNSMGETPMAVISNSWDGTTLRSFFDSVPTLCQLLIKHTLNHYNYPVIHYFHSSQQRRAITLTVAKLDETHLLLTEALAPGQGQDQLKLRMLRAALNEYYAVVPASRATESAPGLMPPLPATASLAANGLTLLPSAEIEQRFAAHRAHRARVQQLLHNDGWGWAQVYPATD